MDRLKQALQVETEDAIKLMEICSMLVLMLHWQRGIIDSLVKNNIVNLEGDLRNNWERVIQNLDLYEQFIWEIVPSRAMLLQLRNFRLTGELEEGFEALLKKDSHGRVPYELSQKDYDDIEDLIRRLKDTRQTFGHGHSLL